MLLRYSISISLQLAQLRLQEEFTDVDDADDVRNAKGKDGITINYIE